MPRFFIEDSLSAETSRLILKGADFHHIRDVLRLRTGDEIIVCDGASQDLVCRLEKFLPDGVELTVLERSSNQSEPLYRVTLYQGLTKGDKMDTIIQKAVELGAVRIVPVACQRSVTRLDEHNREKKVQRWQRIAAEAAKQCGRGQVPEIGPVLDFADAVSQAALADLSLVPWEGERERSVRAELESSETLPADPSISLLIGPEGGFDADEITLAMGAGICPVTLGRRILRTETAGTAVLAMILYHFEDF